MEKKFGFGVMRLPLVDPSDRGSVDMDASKRMIDVYLERGFTYFDTAWFYHEGKSEGILKELLVERYPRDAYQITSKLPSFYIHSPEDAEQIFRKQIERTGVTYFDYYLLHNLNESSIENFGPNGCFEWLQELKASGRARHIGFSMHDSPEFLERMLTEHPEMDVVQLQLNYLDWDSLGVRARESLEICRKFGKPVIVMEPCKGGTLAVVPERVNRLFREYAPDRSVPSWAIRFAASQPGVMLVLSGMSSMDQLLDNLGFMRDFVPMTEEELAICRQAADIINEQTAIACTGCSYCTQDCPKQIPIPQYFSLYNADMQELSDKPWKPQGEYYDNLTKRHSSAADCIRCGLCETHCPQRLPIRDYLEEVAEHFRD